MTKRASGVLIFLCIFLSIRATLPGQSKKAYELIYEDIQLLKKQLLALDEKVDRTVEAVRLLKEQLKDIQTQVKTLVADQAGIQSDLKKAPVQTQALLEKLDALSQQLNRISEDLLALKPVPPPAVQEPAKPDKKETTPQKKAPEQKKSAKSEPAEKKPPVTPVSNISPQEVYNMAYADYLDGNFDLAVDGFKTYREHFPESPLADNALFWIGECYFSQKKFSEAINMFDELALGYPQSDKTAAAYLKKGFSLVELGKKDDALAVFKLIIGKFPIENEAKLAQQKIKELAGK